MLMLVTKVRNPAERSLSNREHVSYIIKVRWDGFQQGLTVGLYLPHRLGFVRQADPLPVVIEMASQQPQDNHATQAQDGSGTETQEGSDWLSLSHVTTLGQERACQSHGKHMEGSTQEKEMLFPKEGGIAE